MRSCRIALPGLPSGLLTVMLIGLLLAPCPPAHAAPNDLATLVRAQLHKAASAQFITASRIEVQVRAGAGAGLPGCGAPLTVDAHGQRPQGNVSVTVTCPGGTGWVTHVAAQIKVFVPVVVLSEPLERGDRVAAAQVQLQEQELTAAGANYFIAVAQVVGQQARQRLRAGQVIAPWQLERPLLVNRGDRVALHAGDTDFQISVVGEALQSGRHGEQIRVRNVSSGRVVSGWVDSTGTVNTHPPSD